MCVTNIFIYINCWSKLNENMFIADLVVYFCKLPEKIEMDDAEWINVQLYMLCFDS